MEVLHDCPDCGRKNFTAAGLKAHRCKGAPAVSRKAGALPELSAIVVALGATRDRLETLARSYDRQSMADRLWLGVCCTAAQERHAIAVTEALDRKGKGKNQNRVTRDTISTISPDQPHPQGFQGWLTNAAPWLNRATAYKYIDAARGAGLTAVSTLDDVRTWTEEMLRRDETLSLAALVAAGRKLLPPPPGNEDEEKTDWVQLTWDSIWALQDHRDRVLAHKARMTPTQYKRACAEAYKTLRDLTEQPWAPSDEEFEHYVTILNDPKKVER